MSHYQLDCPFDQKESVKKLGARWDHESKKWFVPNTHFGTISKFNTWRPNNCIFLVCSFKEKDQVKALGGRWDATVRHWYITSSMSASKFAPWIPSLPEDSPPSNTKQAPGKSNRGNALIAATLKITDQMTVSQLQNECRHRGVNGFSGKSKGWLLDQLGRGSNWLSFSASQPTAKTPVKSPAKTAEKVPQLGKPVVVSKAKRPPNNPAENSTPKKKAKAPKHTTPKANAKQKEKTISAVPCPKSSRIDLTKLLRISSNLTLAQLSHELLYRSPDTKGLSNKSKAWFLSRLGENSIWITAPPKSIDVSSLPLVSGKMTIAQLITEIKYRLPKLVGLSSKNKEDLLQLAAVGSVWMTAPLSSAATKTKQKVEMTNKNTPTLSQSQFPRPVMMSSIERVAVPVQGVPRCSTKAKKVTSHGSTSNPTAVSSSTISTVSPTKAKLEQPEQKSITKRTTLTPSQSHVTHPAMSAMERVVVSAQGSRKYSTKVEKVMSRSPHAPPSNPAAAASQAISPTKRKQELPKTTKETPAPSKLPCPVMSSTELVARPAQGGWNYPLTVEKVTSDSPSNSKHAASSTSRMVMTEPDRAPSSM